ncbi:UNVERIFIED_ORG: hypothetical protein M2382_001648 [Enterobacter sp. BIGb0239]
MADDVNYYTGNITESHKGTVKLDNDHYVAELTIEDKSITITIMDFNGALQQNYLSMFSLENIVFNSNSNNFLLFGLTLNKSHHLKVGRNGRFNDYSYSAQGFIYGKGDLNPRTHFSSISIYGENIKKWSGFTKKLDRVLNSGLRNHLPAEDDCIEFEKNINGLGTLGLYYSYTAGGIEGLHTVGMSVKPHIAITFEKSILLDALIEQYTDLYMMLRFLIGSSLDISQVKIQSAMWGRNAAQLYLAERSDRNKKVGHGIFLSFSTIFRDDSENDFPLCIWDKYYDSENKDIKELLKKYVSYTMVDSNEEKFLGFYRLIETMTMKKSSYVDENQLAKVLKIGRRFLARQFPGASISDFSRAIKQANKSRHNTESCIHHFINGFPQPMIDRLNLKEIVISEICKSRNKIIHQPLFSESIGRIYRFKEITEALALLAILVRLGVSNDKIEEMAISNGLQNIFSLQRQDS